MKTRIGKIARLPAEIREAVNQRLEQGQPAGQLLPWLNNLPEVRRIMVEQFDGLPVSPQNISEWRKGGYRDWLAKREEQEIMRSLKEDAASLTDEASPMPSDFLSIHLMARFARVMASTRQVRDWSKPAHWKRLCELSELVTALRKGDHSAERLRLERAHLEAEQKRLRLLEEGTRKRTLEEWREWTRRTMEAIFRAYPDDEQRALAVQRLLFGQPWEGGEDQTQSN